MQGTLHRLQKSTGAINDGGAAQNVTFQFHIWKTNQLDTTATATAATTTTTAAAATKT